MTHTPRRRIVRRAVIVVAVVVLSLASYIAGGPGVFFMTRDRLPSALPVVSTLYAPLGYWYDNTTIPGSPCFRAYCDWCEEQLSHWIE